MKFKRTFYRVIVKPTILYVSKYRPIKKKHKADGGRKNKDVAMDIGRNKLDGVLNPKNRNSPRVASINEKLR